MPGNSFGIVDVVSGAGREGMVPKCRPSCRCSISLNKNEIDVSSCQWLSARVTTRCRRSTRAHERPRATARRGRRTRIV
jgi:hypothetical protein